MSRKGWSLAVLVAALTLILAQRMLRPAAIEVFAATRLAAT